MSYKEMFQHIVDELLGDSLSSGPSWIELHAKQLLIGCAVVIAGGVGVWYIVQGQKDTRQKATAALFETLQEYQDAERGGKENSMSDVHAAVKSGVSLFGSTQVGSYFNALQAEVDQREGDRAAARFTMHKAASALSESDPLKDIYTISAARMDLEQGDAQAQEKALKVLESYARTQSYYQDMAQYYLGTFYIASGKQAEGRTVLSELISSQEKFEGKDTYSPWADAARQVIDQVIA